MYVAARGGEGAIQNSQQLYHDLKAPLTIDAVREIERSLPYLIDRVMGEGSLYAPDLAALALAQCGGDVYEATLMLRAYRSTQPRIGYAEPVSGETMTTVRRISAAFKDIPGGQVLGPSLDYSHRILRLDVLDGRQDDADGGAGVAPAGEPMIDRLPTVAAWQREQDLLPEIQHQEQADPEAIPDVTREPLLFPTSRAVRLQSLSRAETGGVLALGYANMRGYGSVHPTINELRLGYADVQITHPISGEKFCIGRVRMSQAEVVTTMKGKSDDPKLALGYCATVGWNEVKTIAGSMLDMAMDLADPHPSHTEEYVLYHTDPVESSGFCIHYKLPHYVTFGSSLDAMRAVKLMSPARSAKNGYYGNAEELTAAMPGVHAERATIAASETAAAQTAGGAA